MTSPLTIPIPNADIIIQIVIRINDARFGHVRYLNFIELIIVPPFCRFHYIVTITFEELATGTVILYYERIGFCFRIPPNKLIVYLSDHKYSAMIQNIIPEYHLKKSPLYMAQRTKQKKTDNQFMHTGLHPLASTGSQISTTP